MASCKVCCKRVLSHARYILCCNCNNRVHMRCLSRVSVEDSIYKNRDTNKWICPVCIQDALAFNHYNDDDEFIESVSESWAIDPILPLDIIQARNFFFSPFELN